MRYWRFLIALLVLLVSAPKVSAAGEFDTSFISTYTVTATDSASVVHEIDFKNNLSHIYPTVYTLSTGSDRVENVKASDDSGTLPTTVDTNGAATTLTVKFSNPQVGQGKITHLRVSYDTSDVSEVLGNTVTINIPRMTKANELVSYERDVVLPTSYPPLSVSSPQPTKTEALDGKVRYSFIGGAGSSITMLFGDFATYHLSLSYDINNPTAGTADTEIALPPDTPYQKILLDSLVPEPKAIRLDPDGNWLATYTLKAGDSETVTASLYASVYPLPKEPDPSTLSPKLLVAEKYWESDDPGIKNLVATLKTIPNVYSYLTSNFQYNSRRVTAGAERLGASRAFADPLNAICTEFTDAFVAASRSLQTPAREIEGYAYSSNLALRPLSVSTDVLHAWPEFYDRSASTWHAVDPTWEVTTGGIDYFSKLDFNHIAFVRHGAESSYPFPAGAYKNTAEKKTVTVELATAPSSRASYRLETGNPDQIVNNGNIALVNQSIDYQGRVITVSYLPPYGRMPVPKDTSAPSRLNFIPTWIYAILTACANWFSKFLPPR